MKKIIILAALLIVSVSAFAQSKPIAGKSKIDTTVAKKDTLIYIKLPKQGVELLLASLEGLSNIVRRSPDISALQADESAKTIVGLEAEIYRQIKSQLPPRQPDAFNGNPKSKKQNE